MTQQPFQINGLITKEPLGMLPQTIGEPLWISGDVIRTAFAMASH